VGEDGREAGRDDVGRGGHSSQTLGFYLRSFRCRTSLPQNSAGCQQRFRSKTRVQQIQKKTICQPKSLGWLPHGVSGFFAMKDHGDEAKAENCSNYAANDGEGYRNMMNFKQD
jgi:hypothetical protein